MPIFKEGTKVLIHSLGDSTPGEYRAIVRGVTAEYYGECVYILEQIDFIDPTKEYSCITMVSACVKEYTTPSELTSARERALARGVGYMQMFEKLSKNEKIETLAALIYRNTILDPQGYPNGMPVWDELPEVDHSFKIGLDKYRFLNAAEHVYKMLEWKSK